MSTVIKREYRMNLVLIVIQHIWCTLSQVIFARCSMLKGQWVNCVITSFMTTFIIKRKIIPPVFPGNLMNGMGLIRQLYESRELKRWFSLREEGIHSGYYTKKKCIEFFLYEHRATMGWSLNGTVHTFMNEGSHFIIQFLLYWYWSSGTCIVLYYGLCCIVVFNVSFVIFSL